MSSLLVIGLTAAVVVAGCGRAAPPVSPAPEWFVERAIESRLDFVHVNGMSGRFYMVEVLAPGVAMFDYDRDGDLDVYLVQGQPLDAGDASSTAGDRRFFDRLYRNDLTIGANGQHVLQFTDVTAESRLRTPGYGMGVAAGDYDNDGWVDLYLTKFDAPNQLLHNNGDGTFDDVAARTGTDHRSWGASASFVDVNRDGWLDLYVANYLRYSLDDTAPCFAASGAVDYCTPDAFQPLPDRLFLNQGDGTFEDATVSSGIAGDFGPGLGVVTADFDGDGWPDVFVANDGREDQLWLNRRDGSFENGALLAGVALPMTGTAEASMGVDAGDFDDDGDDDLVMTELTGQGMNLYANDGAGLFEDRSAPSGLGPATVSDTGFGTAWFDFDNDGRLDLLTVNGTVQVIEALRQAGEAFPLHQPNRLFHNEGDGRFADVTARAGLAFSYSEVSRGAAFGDLDNDGDTDVLIGNNNGPVRLLVNQAPAGHHWIGLRLVGAGGRDMLGARVEVVRDGALSVWRRAHTDGSYASAGDPRVIVGLGASAEPPTVRVTWPSGRVETWVALPIDRYSTLEEGTGG